MTVKKELEGKKQELKGWKTETELQQKGGGEQEPLGDSQGFPLLPSFWINI